MSGIVFYTLLYIFVFVIVAAILVHMFKSPKYQEKNEEMREYNDKLLKTMYDFFRAIGEDNKALDIERELKRRGYSHIYIEESRIEEWK